MPQKKKSPAKAKAEPALLRRLRRHFDTDPAELPIVEQEFAVYQRPNLHLALEETFAEPRRRAEQIGVLILEQYREARLAELTRATSAKRFDEGPVKYIDVPIASGRRLACVKRALYLFRVEDKPARKHLRDQDGGRDDVQWLRPFPRHCLPPQLAGVRHRVGNVGLRADETRALPVSQQFRASARLRPCDSSRGQQSQGVLREREVEPGGLGGEFGFQLRRQFQNKAHAWILFLSQGAARRGKGVGSRIDSRHLLLSDTFCSQETILDHFYPFSTLPLPPGAGEAVTGHVAGRTSSSARSGF